MSGRVGGDGVVLKPRQAGFSKMELLCVLAIVTIICLFTAPALITMSARWRLEAAAWRLASEMRLAQQAAVTTGLSSWIEFRRHNNDYRVISSPGRRVLIRLPESISYSSVNFPVSFSSPRLYFHRTGAPNRGGTVALQNRRGQKLYIIVTPATGRVRISKDPPEHW